GAVDDEADRGDAPAALDSQAAGARPGAEPADGERPEPQPPARSVRDRERGAALPVPGEERRQRREGEPEGDDPAAARLGRDRRDRAVASRRELAEADRR